MKFVKHVKYVKHEVYMYKVQGIANINIKSDLDENR